MDMSAYLKDLEYLINIDSGSENIAGLNTIASFFSNRFRDIGWIVREHDLAPHSGKCLICANREAEHYDLMLMGHMDTVFLQGTCAQRPFRIEGNRAFGPGVCDMKQGCLMMYYLLKDLPPEVNEKLNILAVFNPDEEIGSVYSKPVYIPYAQKTDYTFLFEARSSRGPCCHQRKGATQWSVEFTGKSGHCGGVFTNDARSAISEMARWVVALDQLQDKEKATSVNIGMVSGGTKPNVVAEQATMSVDIRYSIPEEAQRVEETLRRLLLQAQTNGIQATIVNKRGKLPWVPGEKANAYLEHIAALTARAGIPLTYRARGGLSDANIVAQYCPVCLDGLGAAGGRGHSPEEYMLLDTIEPCFRTVQLLMQDLADNKKV